VTTTPSEPAAEAAKPPPRRHPKHKRQHVSTAFPTAQHRSRAEAGSPPSEPGAGARNPQPQTLYYGELRGVEVGERRSPVVVILLALAGLSSLLLAVASLGPRLLAELPEGITRRTNDVAFFGMTTLTAIGVAFLVVYLAA
jgi:hypothetical protein